MRNLIIIGTFINNLDKELEILKLCETLSEKYDICVSSHYPVPASIQKLCRFTIYDSNNDLLDPNSFIIRNWHAFFFNDNIDCKFATESNPCLYFYAVYSLLYNAVKMAELHGYEKFAYLEGDFLIDKKDVGVIDKWFECQSCAFNVLQQDIMSIGFFVCNLKLFLNKIPFIKNSKEYLDLVRIKDSGEIYFLEQFFYHRLIDSCDFKFEKERMEDHFPNSVIDKYTDKERKEEKLFDVVKCKTDNNYYLVFFNDIKNTTDKYTLFLQSDLDNFVLECNPIHQFEYYRLSGKQYFYIKCNINNRYLKHKFLSVETIDSQFPYYYLDLNRKCN